MPNPNKPSGLVPVSYLNGAPWTGGGRVYCIPDTDDTNAFAIGDPVDIAGGADSNGVPTITLATAGTGNPVLGCIVSGAGALSYGSSYGVPAESPIVIPATKARNYYVLVADDPNIIFEIQEEATGTALTAADVGLNGNLVSGTNNGYISPVGSSIGQVQLQVPPFNFAFSALTKSRTTLLGIMRSGWFSSITTATALVRSESKERRRPCLAA